MPMVTAPLIEQPQDQCCASLNGPAGTAWMQCNAGEILLENEVAPGKSGKDTAASPDVQQSR